MDICQYILNKIPSNSEAYHKVLKITESKLNKLTNAEKKIH